MKTFKASYYSSKNLFKGDLIIHAEDHKQAMLKFFEWIQTKPTWNHLWSISVVLTECENFQVI